MSADARRVLIAGGGLAAVEALLALRALAEERVAIELLSPSQLFTVPAYSVGGPLRLERHRATTWKRSPPTGMRPSAARRFRPSTRRTTSP